MEITLENTGSSTRLLKVKIPVQRVKAALDEYYAQLAPRAKVAGFRPGKIPRPVLEKNFQQDARQEVIQHLVPRVYHEIVTDKQLQSAMPPLLTKVGWTLDGALYFEAQVDLVPDIKLPAYHGIAVEITQADATDKDVEEALNHLRDKHAELVPLTGRGLRSGDVALLDQKVSVGEHVLEDSKDLSYELDEARLAPEMYKGLLDAKAGDTKEVAMNVPEHYPKKEFAGKPATISFSIKEIKEKKLPELNDEFAKDVGECGSLADLKGKIRENLEKYQKEMAKMQTESKVNEFLVKNAQMTLSDRLVQRQRERLHEAAVEKKQAPEKPDEAYWRMLNQRATDQLKLYFIYQKIAQAEKIEATDAEVEEKIAGIAKQIGQSAGVVREYYKKDDRIEDLKERIQQDKTSEFLISQAKVKTVPPAKAEKK